ncbi:MAG: NAD(P)-dependent alcohol dehydrogenase [Halobacteriota archaeon]
MRIHAFAARAPKAALQPFDYEQDNPGPYDVDVKVSHCGICHSDVHLIDNDWNISHYPLVPGHEIVGTVAATGTAVEQLKIGERVGVGWQSGSCLRCEWCLNGYENLCQSKVLTCVQRHGGFADFVRTDSRFTFSIPESLDSAGAAPLLCAGVTVYAPMRRCGVRPHHHVGVVGIGGLGHLALQFAHAMGCEVTAFSMNPEKEGDAAAFGADHFVVSRDPAQMRRTVRTLDFILATATAPLPWTAYIKALRPNGKLTIVSRLSSNGEEGVVTAPASLLVAGQKSIAGSVTGGRAVTQEMLAFAARHDIAAKTELFSCADINSAVERVRNNAAHYRVVLET